MSDLGENTRLHLVHWNQDEAEALASALRTDGWFVTIDHGSGRFKMSDLRLRPPKAVLISLRRLPSHGREVADALWSTKWSREIPIIFFDGTPDKVTTTQEIFPQALFTTWEYLSSIINNL